MTGQKRYCHRITHDRMTKDRANRQGLRSGTLGTIRNTTVGITAQQGFAENKREHRECIHNLIKGNKEQVHTLRKTV